MIIPNQIYETQKELEFAIKQMGDSVAYLNVKECDRLEYQLCQRGVTGWHVVGRTEQDVLIILICVESDEDEGGQRYGLSYFTLMKGEWL